MTRGEGREPEGAASRIRSCRAKGQARGPALAAASILLWGILWPWSFGWGAEEDENAARAREIVEHADRANRPPALVETLDMVLRHEDGKRFERRLRIRTRQRPNREDVALLRFLAPDEIRGAGLLTEEHPGGEDTQWFYLPATRKIRRIAGAERRNRFMGTEFLYEDLQGYHPESYRYRLLGQEEADGESCHRIEAVPKGDEQAARTAYLRRIFWIGTDTAVLRKAQFFDRKGSELKRLTATEVEEVAPGIYLAGALMMENLQNGRTTSLETLERELPEALPEELFTQRNLRRRLRPDER